MKSIPYQNLLILVSAIIITFLFYDSLLGLNLLLFELATIGLAYWFYKPKLNSTLSKLLLFGTILTALIVVIHNSQISKFVNIISFLLLLGSISFYHLKTIKSYLTQFVFSCYKGVESFFMENSNSKTKKIRVFKTIRIIIIPVIIIFFFFIIYYLSNEKFSEISDSFFKKIGEVFNWLPSISFRLIITFLCSLILSIIFFYRVIYQNLISNEKLLSDKLERRRIPLRSKNFIALKSEYKSGIFLLAILNFMLLIFNYSDITTIWFGYEWDGGYLKSFVHEGTYLLIVSVIVSIIIVLYYFRGNLNFYTKNKWLKTLTFIWLSQNLLLVISLCIRNTIYINHFSLAYKRIGVYAFLAAVTFGIITIIYKVHKKRSSHFIIQKNTFSIYIILLSLTLVNWDVFIAKYNLSSYDKSFIELNFLTQLSDKALPYVNLEHEKLNKLETQQAKSFSFSSRSYYMNKETYKETIERKILKFVRTYPDRSWLEWNYADAKAYDLLKKDK